MTPDAPLAGARILVPRPRDRGERLASLLRGLGGEVDLRAAIAFTDPEDVEAAERAVAGLSDYDWVVVTSPTGVECLVARTGGLSRGVGPRFAAIGPGTARRLERAGRPADIVATRSDSEGLAEALAETVRHGERVLVVRPETASDAVPTTLRALGAIVEAVAFYRTVPHPEAGRIARDLVDGSYDAVVFTSPSTLHAILGGLPGRESAVRDALSAMRRIAIGAVTAAALDEAGLDADATAIRPTDEAVAEAVAAAFGAGPGRDSVC